MNMEDIHERLKEIETLSKQDDSEGAHVQEEKLYVDFIKSITIPGEPELHSTQQLLLIRQKAKEVLKAGELHFFRGYY
jgi:hypothetical protein